MQIPEGPSTLDPLDRYEMDEMLRMRRYVPPARKPLLSGRGALQAALVLWVAVFALVFLLRGWS